MSQLFEDSWQTRYLANKWELEKMKEEVTWWVRS